MANENIGEIVCAWCGNDAPVRRRKDKKLYVMCDGCGQQFLNGPTGQDIILNRADIYGVNGPKVKSAAAAVSEPEPAPPIIDNVALKNPVPQSTEPKIEAAEPIIQQPKSEPPKASWFSQLLKDEGKQ